MFAPQIVRLFPHALYVHKRVKLLQSMGQVPFYLVHQDDEISMPVLTNDLEILGISDESRQKISLHIDQLW